MATKVGFGDQHLSQHSAAAFTCKFAQRIVDGLTLTEGDDSGISRRGISLLRAGLILASIRRLHAGADRRNPTASPDVGC
jgi:hypothetical protein